MGRGWSCSPLQNVVTEYVKKWGGRARPEKFSSSDLSEDPGSCVSRGLWGRCYLSKEISKLQSFQD